jgi:hypothetical protein
MLPEVLENGHFHCRQLENKGFVVQKSRYRATAIDTTKLRMDHFYELVTPDHFRSMTLSNAPNRTSTIILARKKAFNVKTVQDRTKLSIDK